jgi:hypothetical protein
MQGVIYLIQGEELIEMREQEYDSEDLFQRHLAEHPELLAGDQIDQQAPRRWLLVAREVPVPAEGEGGGRWSLDHLFLDQDGIPTLVEVKRSSDTRLRREVVGQMLDYAANAVVYWPLETIRSQFKKTWESREKDSETVLISFLGSDGDPDAFWQKVDTNLQTGKIRMLFVADEIPQELKRIVEFLNEQMNPAEVLAMEIRQYASGTLQTLVPRVIGHTARTDIKKGSARGEGWTEDRFLRALESTKGADEGAVAEEILKWAKRQKTEIAWGRGKQYGTFTPVLEHKGVEFYPFTVWTNGYIQVSFGTLKSRPPFDADKKRLELLDRVNSHLEEKLPIESIRGYPSIRLSAVSNPKTLEGFLQTFTRFLDEVRAS